MNKLKFIQKGYQAFINQYNWKEIDFPSNKNNWKTFELNNKSIALYILHMPYKKIWHASKSKHNLNCENQITFLLITDVEKWHYLAVKKLSALLKGITGNDYGDFYCLNCFHSCTTKNKIKKHENACKTQFVVM